MTVNGNILVGDDIMTTHHHYYTQAEKEDILNMYSQGYSSLQIAEKYHKAASTIANNLKRWGAPMRSNAVNSKKYTCNENFFECIDSEEKAYWLGFLYADGYVSGTGDYNCGLVGCSLSSKDRTHLEKMLESFDSNYPIHDYKVSSGYKPGTGYSRVVMRSSKLYDDAVAQGIVEHKTPIIQPPNIPKEYSAAFIRGYFDGDGSVTIFRRKHWDRQRRAFAIKILGTVELLDYIKDFLTENHVAKIRKYHKRHSGDTVKTLEFSGNQQVKHFLDLIYGDNPSVYLNRKFRRYQFLCYYLNSRVTSKGVA